MKINLVTDAKRHNLALMKASTCHKMLGDQVYLNGVGCFDLTIGSWLFDFSEKVPCDLEGGPGIDPTIRLTDYDQMKPDYSLFNLDYSLGYTWAYCPRKCPFCIVPKQNNPKEHHFLHGVYDEKLICAKGYKPRFYAPKGTYPHWDGDWGWKRVCKDYKDYKK